VSTYAPNFPPPAPWKEVLVPYLYDPFGEYADGTYWFDSTSPSLAFREVAPLAPSFRTREVVVETVPAS
jgi:hypothetical protein